MTNGLKRILSIDGGGIKGVLPAAFLAHVETTTGKKIADHFDLISGTSTGGIIALGLGLGLSANDILDMYRHKGPDIFYQEGEAASWWRKAVTIATGYLRKTKRVVMPMYNPDRLRDALVAVFQEQTLGESRARLVIPAYHSAHREVYVFKTAHHPRFQTDHRERAVDVALATAAAPTYFPSHRLPNGCDLIDGGIWANNPVGPSVVEAIGVLGWNAEDIRVLSLGCTEDTFTVPSKAGGKDLLFATADLFLQGQSKASMGTAKILLRHTVNNPKIFRYSHVVAEGRFDVDKIKMIDELRGIGFGLARDALPTLNEVFLTRPAESFQPHHSSL